MLLRVGSGLNLKVHQIASIHTKNANEHIKRSYKRIEKEVCVPEDHSLVVTTEPGFRIQSKDVSVCVCVKDRSLTQGR